MPHPNFFKIQGRKSKLKKGGGRNQRSLKNIHPCDVHRLGEKTAYHYLLVFVYYQ
jgi:hypothetical protein